MALNSVIVAAGCTAVSLLLAIPGSYGLTRLGLPRRIGTPLALIIGFAVIFPAISIVIPMFRLAIQFQAYDRLDTLIALNVPFNAAFALWVLAHGLDGRAAGHRRGRAPGWRQPFLGLPPGALADDDAEFDRSCRPRLYLYVE